MEKVYSLTSTKQVKNLEAELKKEIKELRERIEDAESLYTSGTKSFSSVSVPRDAEYFRNERKFAFRIALKVRQATPLLLKSDVMKDELASSIKDDYKQESIGIILHQFFIERAQSLAYCKAMHMLRWARICRDSKTIGSLYTEYRKRLDLIMKEHRDAADRAKRLSICRDLNQISSSSQFVTKDDLLIYTRWLICHLHSVKHIHSFVKVLEWLPSLKQNQVRHDGDCESGNELEPSKSQVLLRTINRKLSHVGKGTPLMKRSGATFSETNIPAAPILPPDNQKGGTHFGDVTAIAAASGGGLASNEVNLSIPINDTDLTSYASLLDFLLSCYGIPVQRFELKNRSDEMDMLHLVLKKFKNVYYEQEQMRHFPTYDTLTDSSDAKLSDQSKITTFKKSCDWLDFVQIRPKIDGIERKNMTLMKQKNLIDELLRIQSQFFHVSDSQKALSCLREHVHCILEQTTKLHPVSVTTHKTGNGTHALWNKIFDYANRRTKMQKKEPLGFEVKLSSDDIPGLHGNDLDLSAAVEMLGLENDDHKKHPLLHHGTYLAYMALRHLRIRDLQRTCLGILNYFRSVERTLTVDDGGLLANEDGYKLNKMHPDGNRSSLGIGSHQYTHNTLSDFRSDQDEFLETLELENHDDFYSFIDGRIHVQDYKGLCIMYGEAFKDFKELEHQLLLVGSHFIGTHRTAEQKKFKNEQRGNNFDLNAYSHEDVDRFGVILDLWTNETAFLENKRKLVSCYLELYQHVFDPKEKHDIAQIMTDAMHQRPRFNLAGSYFIETYRNECQCLRLRFNLIEIIANKQVEMQREYVQKVTREQNSAFGMPLKIIPLQTISLIESRPALKHIYLLEFHPSLATVSKVIQALAATKQEFERIHKPEGPNQMMTLEKRLYEVAITEYQSLKPAGHDYSTRLQRDLFSETFIEDPLFVCNFGQSAMSSLDIKGRKAAKEEKIATVQFWCKILQIITLRHRLIECCDESSLLSQVYKKRVKDLGFDECHLYLRAVSFEFAQKKPEIETKPISTSALLLNDGLVDRYTPSTLTLAVQELDEKHVGFFSLRTQDGLLQLCQDFHIERLKTTLMCQICHKNLLAASIFQIDGCIISERRAGLIAPSCQNLNCKCLPVSVLANGFEFQLKKTRDLCRLKSKAKGMVNKETTKENLGNSRAGDDDTDYQFKTAKLMDAFRRKLQESFVSVQVEKLFLRNRVLNVFVDEKATKGVIMNNVDEVIKLKRKVIELFCEQVQERTTLHSLRSQIVSYVCGIKDLMDEFPQTRDSHFVFGDEEDANVSKEKESNATDPTKFRKRPRSLMSFDGKKLLNIWYMPHYKEVLHLFESLNENQLLKSLAIQLRIVSAVHDICQYLCAHSRLGSSHARLGSKTLQFHGVTADWGGTEGIGAELREVQQQVIRLKDPSDPYLVAKFLEKKRDMMFFEFDIAVSRSARNTFLSAGNEKAFKNISECMHSSLQELGCAVRPSVYGSGLSLPDPLLPEDSKSFELCPWRTFLSRYGSFPLMNRPFHKIGYNMQKCLAGLEDVDRHVVNGEILSLSLLLEDALVHGSIDIHELTDFDDVPNYRDVHSDASHSRVASAKKIETAPPKKEPTRKLSLKETPMESTEFLHDFLLLHSTLEQIKDDWACRKLGVLSIKTTKLHRAFLTAYKKDILQIIYKQIAAKRDQKDSYAKDFIIDDNEPLAPPKDVGEYESKARQLIRLLETLECSMINDVIKRLSREHTLVINERTRDDPNLPTDLWKKPSTKENFVISRPHIVEDYIIKLMEDHIEDSDSVTFNKDHFENCLMKLASDTMKRERHVYDSYTGFYDGILRQQHQVIYLKEQEVKQAKTESQNASHDQGVEVDCLMADRCRSLVLEVTALRGKVSELTEEVTEQEKWVRARFQQEYCSLVIELFNNAFGMRNRFEQFRSCLYDDVFDSLGDVRKLAVESMKKLRERSGQNDIETNVISQRLIRAEQLREAQWESTNLYNVILKLKALSHWNKTKNVAKTQLDTKNLRQQLSLAKRETLETGLLQDEKEILLKQEISALRKALNHSEKECQILRKKLANEHKIRMQKSNSQLQEAFSQRKIDLAKSANMGKLLQELEEKEEKLKSLAELTDRDSSVSRRSKAETKKALKQIYNQLYHERSLKLDAFERCDDLQKQVDEYEEQLELHVRPTSSQSHHNACFPAVPGGRTSPQKALISTKPQTHAAIRSYQRSKMSKGQSYQPNQWWTSPAPATSFTSFEGSSSKSRPRTVNSRLKKKISETFLTDYDASDDIYT